jgi:XrtJ-associated TM-motif-TM protein
MKEAMLIFLGCRALLSVTVLLHAHTGCSDTPEDPSVVLVLVRLVSAFFSAVCARLRVCENCSMH